MAFFLPAATLGAVRSTYWKILLPLIRVFLIWDKRFTQKRMIAIHIIQSFIQF